MTKENLQPHHVTISKIDEHKNKKVLLKGWVYNKRDSSKIIFLHLRDGSGFIQGILSKEGNEELFEQVKKLGQESSVIVEGIVKEEERAPYCGHEIHITNVNIISTCDNYPISKKAHGDAFLMDNRHLWLRSRRQHAILRIRATIIKTVRDYFDNKGFLLVDSPIFTPNACEGTSTLFETQWFDDSKAYLSQSGQLYQEACAMAFGKTYCFGPTFRAEKSKTRRHLNEFWMVEPEVAFMDIWQNIDLAEDLLVNIVSIVLEKHSEELSSILERDIEALKKVQKPFVRLSYDKAVEMIKELQTKAADEEQKKLLDIHWGMDFGSPHETELTKQFDRPIVVYGFPSAIKAFYMKKDEKNPQISLSMDILAPEGYGEIIGGGQREDNLDLLVQEIKRHGLKESDFAWFLDLRRYGSVPHSGFGLGIERCVAYICGLHHVRETIPFARTLDRLYP